MSSGIFVTATGTDVGKTYITARLIKALRSKGINAGYYKAALSGAVLEGGKRIAGDAACVYRFAGLKGDSNQAVTTILDYPASPHLAAQLEDKSITLPPILRDFGKAASIYDYVVMEGSGGIICPLNLGESPLMLTDVIKTLALDIVIVADAGLGTINSTLLTFEYARNLKIETRCIVLNRFDASSVIHQDNKKVLEAVTGRRVLVCNDHGDMDASSIKKILGKDFTHKFT
ncbi:dethiobiotin synthase [Eubacterium sp. 1001713B170207_170306_E7]|uniref:dethiobiotin synthase n=1 Tax=Eubacterium sp. 1001713B170207_170306_E7 TaxID=2787097 RepID=UPI001898178E|nr:dethiobiotin synthase [Eubacterium sp. 1001713B170207_170306_E7]